MSTNEDLIKEAPQGKKEVKELTPGQIQRRKKMIVFPLLFLLFAGSMWLIFAPSKQEEAGLQQGLNSDLPTPKENGIISDKREAYLQEATLEKQQEKIRSLQDFAFTLGEKEEKTAPKTDELDKASSQHTGNTFQSSSNAHEDINRQLGTFYAEPAAEVDEQALLALEWRIQELEKKLVEEQERQGSEAEQLALIEKSYQVAARYMGGEQATRDEAPVAQTTAVAVTGKTVAQPTNRVRRNVVSLLAAPMPDSVFIQKFTKPRNWGFNTAGDEGEQDKNSIRACIYRTVTVTDGQEVGLRLLDPMMAGDRLIPANTVITGAAHINGERMGISVNTILYAGNVIPVELTVYDLDGGQGIFVPGSEEINAAREIAANMGSGMGSSITITDDAGSQLLADLGRSAIQGASQYFSRKMRTVKVTLKAGHQVLLLPPIK